VDEDTTAAAVAAAAAAAAAALHPPLGEQENTWVLYDCFFRIYFVFLLSILMLLSVNIKLCSPHPD